MEYLKLFLGYLILFLLLASMELVITLCKRVISKINTCTKKLIITGLQIKELKELIIYNFISPAT